MADSYPVALRKGLATDLHSHGFGIYKTVGAYTNADTATLPGITTNGPDVPTTFDHALIITSLTPFDDGPANRVSPIQFRSRLKPGATRNDAENFAEALRDHLHGRERFALGDLTFRIALQINSLYITPDEKGRPGFFQTVHFHGRKV